MPQRISSDGLASAKDHTAIIYNGVTGVEGEVRARLFHICRKGCCRKYRYGETCVMEGVTQLGEM